MQLYVSVDAATKESLKAIDRPLFGDFWERFVVSDFLGNQIVNVKLAAVSCFYYFLLRKYIQENLYNRSLAFPDIVSMSHICCMTLCVPVASIL